MKSLPSTMAAILLAALAVPAQADDAQPVKPLGTDLDGFAYPWPVKRMPLAIGTTEGQMSYMDVRPDRPNRQAIVLLHGKNFCGATWESTARALAGAGYRVLIPDQVGFCKSSKPRDAQYSFAFMADATHRLMAREGLERAVILGHSTGGMLALRFAQMFPEATNRLVLVNPLGLTDRMAEGVPYVPLAKLIEQERGKDRAAIKDYQLRTYYHGQWQPRYDRWVDMLAGQYATEDADAVEIAQAKTAEMILTQPVSQGFETLRMPVTLFIGQRDTTTFGKGQAPKDVQGRLKPIPELAPAAAARMPDARVVPFADLGHSPQVEDPKRFEKALQDDLAIQR
ncbi:alpha/beta fold hydrolase [Novosphingobium aquimarinum]|uniref:alpha/beta fold hydrolase n=1 Tax=Novosphingobium aquimarinum TaxID=2682494 RepID=UPI0012EB78B5|nr:alpha/beta hydrolase [Novosphingobium aquimarinum]